MDIQTAADTCQEILTEMERAVIVDREFLETVLVGVVARGHVLLEDVPGTGKTLTARSLATAFGLEFARIQFTPDLLPGDITGANIFNEQERVFEFAEGPIFANVVLADEINRAPPKTQAAVLEAMGEAQVTVDGETRQLPTPFIVLATQNPVEQEGTFPLPEAQVDRFIVKASMGYPDKEGERTLVKRRLGRTEKAPSVEPVIDGSVVAELQQVPEQVEVDPTIQSFIVDLGRATRRDDRVEVGVSPRGIQRLVEASRARAVISGRSYVAPEDVTAVIRPVVRHRLVLTPEASVRGTDQDAIIESILEEVAVPAMATPGE